MSELNITAANPVLVNLGRLAFLAAGVFTLYAAFAPPNLAPHLLPWDKAQHFLAFYVLSALGAAAFPRLKAVWIAAALLALGAAIEVIQGLPGVGRDADIHDWLADAVGIAFALGPLALARWREDPSRPI